jgi:hypothetical protein
MTIRLNMLVEEGESIHEQINELLDSSSHEYSYGTIISSEL